MSFSVISWKNFVINRVMACHGIPNSQWVPLGFLTVNNIILLVLIYCIKQPFERDKSNVLKNEIANLRKKSKTNTYVLAIYHDYSISYVFRHTSLWLLLTSVSLLQFCIFVLFTLSFCLFWAVKIKRQTSIIKLPTKYKTSYRKDQTYVIT